jgi:hypothetical protein
VAEGTSRRPKGGKQERESVLKMFVCAICGTSVARSDTALEDETAPQDIQLMCPHCHHGSLVVQPLLEGFDQSEQP